MGCRPSGVYGLEGVEAYCFDSAVTRWGSAFEAALHKAVSGQNDERAAERAQQKVISRWLGLGTTGLYADPRGANKRITG